jgi:hypothetical protein
VESSPPAAKETGATGCEIESRQGIRLSLFVLVIFMHVWLLVKLLLNNSKASACQGRLEPVCNRYLMKIGACRDLADVDS